MAETLGKEDPFHLYSDSVKKHYKSRDALSTINIALLLVDLRPTHIVTLYARNQSALAATVSKDDPVNLDSTVTL